VDRFGHSATSLDELRQIQDEVNSSHSLRQLRSYFERVQELRRIHSGNFDVQLIVAEAQEQIIERARDLRGRGVHDDGDAFERDALTHGPLGTAVAPEPEAVEEQPGTIGTLSPDSKSWRRATILALVLTGVICVVFFSLIQTARRINLPPTPSTTPAKTDSPKTSLPTTKTPAPPATPATPTVRLYTDLIPGTVSIDDGEAQDVKDGELVLDNLEPGRHSLKVAGRSGSADFSFDVSENAAPIAVAPLNANNALAVLVSAQNGKGHLLTSTQQTDVSLDGKPLGQTGPDGLALTELSTSDHDLQVGPADDQQHFVLTYTPAPVLTAYVKSVFNGGVVTVTTKLDAVNVYVGDKLYRRKTENGQVRMALKTGTYLIRVHKDGFVDPPPQTVAIKKSEEAKLAFDLKALPSLASLDVRGALPGAAVLVDKETVATVGADGHATVDKVPAGSHTVELQAEGFPGKKFQRDFQPGTTVTLAGPEIAMQKAPAPETKPAEAAPAAPAPVESAATPPAAVDLPGEQVRRGGGFVHYNTPKANGHYLFQAHSKIGGFLKRDKLQWYAGYEDSGNYVMFSLDGKHASVRHVQNGKSQEVNRISFNTTSGQWVQVDLAIKTDSIGAKIKTPGGNWVDLGSVGSKGADFTQGKVGFYVPGNDEVTVADFRFAHH